VRRPAPAFLRRTSRPWRTALLIAVAFVLGAAVQWTLVETAAVGLRLRQAQGDVASAQQAALDSSAEQLAERAERLAGHLRSASRHADSPPLRLLSAMPLIGPDLHAGRTALAAMSDVGSLAPRVASAGVTALDGARGTSPGVAAVTAAATLEPVLTSACRQVDRSAEQTRRDAPAGRLPLVPDAVTRVNHALRTASGLCQDARSALTVLPQVLGMQGRRSYLLVFQNLAEARPTGGIVGSWALVSADRGRLTLDDTGSNDDWTVWVDHVDQLGPDAQQLYGTDMRRSQNVNLSPHFPYAGQLLASVWRDQGEPAVDGVISVDPVALSYLLRATGPITVDGEPPLTAADVVARLTNTVYQDMGGGTRQRLKFLGHVTGEVFTALSRPGTDPSVLVAGLARGVHERHVMLWGENGSDLGALAAAAHAEGALPAPRTDTVGVFTTNVDGSKLDFYARVDVHAQECDGVPCLKVELGNTAPATVAPYVGNQLPGATPTTRHTAVSLYLPPRRGLERLVVQGRSATVDVGRELGWTVVRTTVDVPRDGVVELVWVLSGDDSPVQHVLTQPAISSVTVD
jgi:hypothetical protein